jgi:sulfur-oxidizing protein SoxY
MANRRHATLLALNTVLGASLWPRAVGAQAAVAEPPPESPIWPKVVASVFDGRPITLAEPGQLQLGAPARAPDPAFVPVTVRTGALAIRRLTLVVDGNPAPVAAVFSFGAETTRAGQADIETRLRVDAYSMVRAVAELADGRLLMSTRYVKAAGGCSAPAGADAALAEAALGRMQLRVDKARLNQACSAQWQVSHPNHSGLAMDQSTRLYTPAHFVRTLAISYRDEPVLAAELDFALSENPTLRFHFVPQAAGELRAEAQDTQGRRFSTRLMVEPV